MESLEEVRHEWYFYFRYYLPMDHLGEARLSFRLAGFEPKSVEVRLRADAQLVNKDIVLDSLDDTNEVMAYHSPQQARHF